jgi:Tol biopolymer transport system component
MSDFADFNIPLDLTNDRAWDGGSSMIPAGTYIVQVSDVQQTQTRSGGAGLRVTFVVDDETSAQNGAKVTKTYSLKDDPGTRGRLKNLLVAAGNTTFTSLSPSMLLGRRMIIEVTHQQGRDQVDATGNAVAGKMRTCRVSGRWRMLSSRSRRPRPRCAVARSPLRPRQVAPSRDARFFFVRAVSDLQRCG